MRTTVILNPEAAGGRARRRLPRLRPLLDEAFATPEILQTQAPGDGARLAKKALQEGCDRIVVVGGDGTINDVVNGFFEDGSAINSEAILAPLACGTGSDLVRSIRERQWRPSTLPMRVRRLARGRTRRIDVGRVRCIGPDGREHTRYFGNVASFGYTAEVINHVNATRRPAWMGGTTTFLWSILRTLWSATPHPVTLRVDGKEIAFPDALCVMFANGRYLAGGIAMAPEASIDDGELDVVALHGASAWRILRSAPAFYLGRHGHLSEVTMLRGRHIEVQGPSGVELETDGEIIGALPARVDVLPGTVCVQG